MIRFNYLLASCFILSLFGINYIDPANPLLWALQDGRHLPLLWLLMAALLLVASSLRDIGPRWVASVLLIGGVVMSAFSFFALVSLPVPFGLGSTPMIDILLGLICGLNLTAAGLEAQPDGQAAAHRSWPRFVVIKNSLLRSVHSH